MKRLRIKGKSSRVCSPIDHIPRVIILGKYRGKLEIIRDILLVTLKLNGAKKTRIMHSANLGYKVLIRYLDELLKAGLIECDGNSDYWLTDKGEVFLRLYEEYDKDLRELENHTRSLENDKKAILEMLSKHRGSRMQRQLIEA